MGLSILSKILAPKIERLFAMTKSKYYRLTHNLHRKIMFSVCVSQTSSTLKIHQNILIKSRSASSKDASITQKMSRSAFAVFPSQIPLYFLCIWCPYPSMVQMGQFLSEGSIFRRTQISLESIFFDEIFLKVL